MTGPTPTPAPKNESEYARKLALAILSTLENKGLLTRLDVDTILHVAHRAATTPTPTTPSNAETAPAARPTPAPVTLPVTAPAAASGAAPRPAPAVGVKPDPRIPPARLDTRWVKPEDASRSAAPVVATLPSVAQPDEAPENKAEAAKPEATEHTESLIVIPSPDETQDASQLSAAATKTEAKAEQAASSETAAAQKAPEETEKAVPQVRPPVIDFTLD